MFKCSSSCLEIEQTEIKQRQRVSKWWDHCLVLQDKGVSLSKMYWHNLSIIVGSEHKHNMSTTGLIALENELVCCCQGHCL